MNDELGAALDKSYVAPMDADMGTISIRVVVLPPKATENDRIESSEEMNSVPGDDFSEVDEDIEVETRRPIDGYLESLKRGKWVGVFLVHGQRQHVLDNTFISRDLEFRYLRHRMMLVVDIDGLSPEAIAHLLGGSRQGFYQGQVYDALYKRVIATLKKDPDLMRIEEVAEQQVASLRTGDHAIREALDALIIEHGQRGHGKEGLERIGDRQRQISGNGPLILRERVVVEGDLGDHAQGPALRMLPESQTLRLLPDVEFQLAFSLYPESDSIIERLTIDFDPPIPELVLKHVVTNASANATLLFTNPESEDEAEFPIESTLRATAVVQGHDEPRLCSRRVLIAPRHPTRSRRPPKPPVLLDTPTYLRVLTRQPIPMTLGGADVHVKLKWDGKDELAGADGSWTFSASHGAENLRDALATFSRPVDGRFELVVPVPKDVVAGSNTIWRVDATGPNGLTLSASFSAIMVEPIAPRRAQVELSGGVDSGNDYEIKMIGQADWQAVQCFERSEWTQNDPGAFDPPSSEHPLILYINEDYQPLVDFKADLTKRQLVESTIRQRTTKYTTHLAFHLWQMYSAQQHCDLAEESGEEKESAAEIDFAAEIRRVATTLLQLMDRTG